MKVFLVLAMLTYSSVFSIKLKGAYLDKGAVGSVIPPTLLPVNQPAYQTVGVNGPVIQSVPINQSPVAQTVAPPISTFPAVQNISNGPYVSNYPNNMLLPAGQSYIGGEPVSAYPNQPYVNQLNGPTY